MVQVSDSNTLAQATKFAVPPVLRSSSLVGCLVMNMILGSSGLGVGAGVGAGVG